ncbi:MAG: CopG family transcriptional regulator [Magnetococcales bacterium]|nr:CopG family transcriptional regulator [Magnetococcales bacterium]
MKTKEGFDFSNGKRGPILPQEGRTRVTVTLSSDIIAELSRRAEAEGTGLQQVMDNALRDHLRLPGPSREGVPGQTVELKTGAMQGAPTCA